MKSSYDLVRDIVSRANEVPLMVCGKEVSAGHWFNGQQYGRESLHFFGLDCSAFGQCVVY